MELEEAKQIVDTYKAAGKTRSETAEMISALPLNGHELEAYEYLERLYSRREEPFNMTDYGNAERFVKLHGDITRYSTERKMWLIWTGKRWEWDLGNIRVQKLAKKTARAIYREASDELDDDLRKELVKHARSTERQARLDAMVESAKSEPGISINLDDLDSNKWLLNVSNGTIDLRDGKLKEHSREDLITELLPVEYDPEAQAEEWDGFLNRIFDNDAELIGYVQRSLGYSITGDQSEQAFFFCYGTGFNGKSTLLNACRQVLGNYALQISPTAFMVDKNKKGGPDEAIASLKNKRLVCSTELEDGQKLSVSLVKRMTGGEPLWCERKFEHGFEFTPTYKLWLSGNHAPIITDTTNSIWNRLKKIPFNVSVPENERRKGLSEYLAKEHGKAILAWLVKGCIEWYKQGDLKEPGVIKRAVSEYRDEQDILHDYLLERCVFHVAASIVQKTLYADYKQWCEENDVHPIGKLTFRSRLIEKGVKNAVGNRNIRIWQGIRLRAENDGVNSVNSVNDFQECFLREEITGKTLQKTANNINNINNFNDLPDCPNCGKNEWSFTPNGELQCPCGYIKKEVIE